MKLLKRRNTPLDTNIVFLHKILIVTMLTLFAYCNYAQLERQGPSCSGSGMINLDHPRKLRLCITTAAYLEQHGQKKYTNTFGLYLPAALIVVALLLYTPLKYQEVSEDKELVTLFKLSPTLPRSDTIRNIDIIIMHSYGVLCKRARLSWECLEADFYSLLILEMISSTNLLSKVIVGVTKERWDYVMNAWNQTYPTNVRCDIGPQMVYAASNTELYSCIIPHNEIYKTIWMVTVIILVFAMLLSLVSLVYHTLQMLPVRRKGVFRGTVDIDSHTLDTLVKELPAGDDSLFLLNSYLLRLPCRDQRKDVVTELMVIVKEDPW